jgi:hypothetical protein
MNERRQKLSTFSDAAALCGLAGPPPEVLVGPAAAAAAAPGSLGILAKSSYTRCCWVFMWPALGRKASGRAWGNLPCSMLASKYGCPEALAFCRAWKAGAKRSLMSLMALSVADFSMMVQPSSKLSLVMVYKENK